MPRLSTHGAQLGGANTGLKPAQTARPANPAQRKINEIVQTKGKEKLQTCSIPAPGTTYIIDYNADSSSFLDLSNGYLIGYKWLHLDNG
jgi:hypothetical protein